MPPAGSTPSVTLSAVSVPLTGAGLAACADQAARDMERTAASDRERAARYLETLFRLAGVAEERLEAVRATLRCLQKPSDWPHRGIGR